ncbi:MAG: FHA domain-containing protein [Myxococcaceae bacterium]
MPERLSTLLSQTASTGAAPAEWREVAVLLWHDAPETKPRELVWSTVPHYKPEPAANDPLVFPITKQVVRPNAFALGVTLGRAQSHDIAVEMPSVSRFHCYFQRDEGSGVWFVVDAESFNGTFCEGVRLSPKRPAPLADRAKLRFGFVEMRFLSSQAFGVMLKQGRL